MAILPIVTYGTDVLKHPVAPVQEINDDIRILAADMIETMHHVNGAGLAATQVGRSLSMFVINGPAAFEDETDEHDDMVFINAEVSNVSGTDVMEEGCLSVPEIRLDVNRGTSLDIRWTGLDGQSHTMHAEGFLARVLQHETDHLKGLLIVDKISSLKKQLIKKKLKEIERNG